MLKAAPGHALAARCLPADPSCGWQIGLGWHVCACQRPGKALGVYTSAKARWLDKKCEPYGTSVAMCSPPVGGASTHQHQSAGQRFRSLADPNLLTLLSQGCGCGTMPPAGYHQIPCGSIVWRWGLGRLVPTGWPTPLAGLALRVCTPCLAPAWELGVLSHRHCVVSCWVLFFVSVAPVSRPPTGCCRCPVDWRPTSRHSCWLDCHIIIFCPLADQGSKGLHPGC